VESYSRSAVGRRSLARNSIIAIPSYPRTQEGPGIAIRFDGLVLIVEDYPCARTLLAEAAEQIGHTVECASTQADSEALLEIASHDLAICDVELFDGSGHDTELWDQVRPENRTSSCGH